MISIRLPVEIETRLAALAKKTGRSKTYYATQAIIDHIQDLEDFCLAEERMHGFTDDKAIPLEDLVTEYGLED